MQFIKYFLCLIFIVAFIHCATTISSNLECARFELDQQNYDQSIACATEVLNADANSIEGAHLLAMSYAGRSDIDFMGLVEVVLELSDSSQSNFSVMANALSEGVEVSDLRLAITTLEAIPNIDGSSLTGDLADSAFDLGMLQAIEHFAIGVYQSNYHTSLDVSGITDDGSSSVESDLVNFDDRLVASGVDSEESFIKEVRQTFCILESISGGEGFTTAEYQALVGCQLSSTPDTFDTTLFSADIANCAALDPDGQTETVQDCYTQDTTL